MGRISGHILLKILSSFIWKVKSYGIILGILIGLIPMSIFTAIVGLELAVGIIQALVFIILTSSYIRDSIDLH